MVLLIQDNFKSSEGPSGLENQQRLDVNLSERLASFGIMGIQIMATLKPSIHHITIVLRGLRGVLNWAVIMPKDSSLSDSECDLI